MRNELPNPDAKPDPENEGDLFDIHGKVITGAPEVVLTRMSKPEWSGHAAALARARQALKDAGYRYDRPCVYRCADVYVRGV